MKSVGMHKGYSCKCGDWSTEIYQSKTIEPFPQYKGTIATSVGMKLNRPVWSL